MEQGHVSQELLGHLPPSLVETLAAAGYGEEDLDAFPLSFAQQRMWLLQETDPEKAAYNISWPLVFDGSVETLVAAVNALAARHEILRTVFCLDADEQPCQVVLPSLPWVPTHAREADTERLEARIREEARRPFDLRTWPLMRGLIVETSETRVLVLTLHHILSDGWSVGILLRELRHFLEGGGPLPELPIQYADFAAWQREQLTEQVLAAELAWWHGALAGAEAELHLPTDHMRPSRRSGRGAVTSAHVSAEVGGALRRLAQTEGTGSFAVLTTAFQLLLHRFCGQEDLCVGTPVAGRGAAETEDLIGCFVNTLVLRSRLDDRVDFRNMLRTRRTSILDAFAHDQLPFERLVDSLNLPRDPARTPLFNTVISYLEVPQTQDATGGLALYAMDHGSQTAKFDLTLNINAHPDGRLLCRLEYNIDLFEQVTAERLLGHLVHLLEEIAADPDRRATALPLMSHTEREAVLAIYGARTHQFAVHEGAHQRFERMASCFPDHPALTDACGDLTYAALNAQANGLAEVLTARGVRPGNLVGICAERSGSLIVAMLAVLKAGGTYLPIDPHSAEARRTLILEDAGVTHVLGESDTTWISPDAGKPTAQNPNLPCDPHTPAYVIYTSGSTGTPKGVLIPHTHLIRLFLAAEPHFALDAHQIWSFFHSFAFDFSVWEIWGALLYGGRSVVVPYEVSRDPERFLDLVLREGVTQMSQTPSAFYLFMEAVAARPGLSLPLVAVTLGGEALDPTRLGPWFDRFGDETPAIVNMYGITETTVHVTVKAVTRADTYDGRSDIGKPLRDLAVYLLDPLGEPVPPGMPGEIHVAGSGVAIGYLNRPELTRARFRPNPFGDGTDRLYKSGDMAVLTVNGTLRYLGRNDHQVKLRGFRIELGEIEACLRRFPKVVDAVVRVVQGDAGQERLRAYYTTADGTGVAARDLRAYLIEHLPAYMVPAGFVGIPRMPLTGNGKLDVAALEALSEDTDPYDDTSAPRTDTERVLAELWCDLLGRTRVSLHDNFFELGGDSITVIQFSARARARGLHLSPQDLFTRQTIAELALLTARQAPVQAPTTCEGPVPLTPIQAWFLAGKPANPHHYNQALQLEATRRLDPQRVAEATRLLVVRHEALRLRLVDGADGMCQDVADTTDVPYHFEPCGSDPAEIETLASRYQTSFHLHDGPVFALVHLRFAAPHPDRLLMMAHHMVVDGVSWRIVIDDFTTLFQGLEADKVPALPPVATSYRAWASVLNARRHEFTAQRAYWQRPLETLPLPRDAAGADTQGEVSHAACRWTQEDTSRLMQAPHPFRARTGDLLLAALAMALRDWFGPRKVLIDLEGHGRETVFSDLDLTQTVGWFTTIHPLMLTVFDEPLSTLKAVKEAYRAVPDKGFAFNLLRYAPEENADAWPQAEISFNFHGRFDTGRDRPAGLLRSVGGDLGPMVDPRNPRPYLLDLTGVIAEGSLRMACYYNRSIHYRGTIEALMGKLDTRLHELVDLCLAPGAGAVTPSDFPLAHCTGPQLARLFPEPARIEDLYPLSAVQEGMLVHSLVHKGSGVYGAQFHFRLAVPYDRDVVARALKAVMDRHPILRTAFLHAHLDRPLQAVYREVPVPLECIDLAAEEEAAPRARAWLTEAGARGFDFAEPGLLHLALLRTTEGTQHLLWRYHHILMDAWSFAIVLRDFMEALTTGVVSRPRPTPYRAYIAHLTALDSAAADAFWREELAGFEEPTPLPLRRRTSQAVSADNHGVHTVHLCREVSDHIRAFARRYRLTLNTLCTAAWGLLLSGYASRNEVLFGTTVSGRPPELDGVEHMVGLFINTLPSALRVDPDREWVAWLNDLQQRAVSRTPFEATPLVSLNRLTDISGTLFESILVFENAPRENGPSQVSDLQQVDAFARTHYPLAFLVGPGTRISLSLEYNSSEFSPADVALLVERLALLLTRAVDHAGRAVGRLSMMLPREAEALAQWNQTVSAYPACSVGRLFEAAADRYPNLPALTYGEEVRTYASLNRRANRLAVHLQTYGVAPGDHVALCLGRSCDMVAAMLAVLKLGAAYVPLDPDFPMERNHAMLEDAGVQCVMATNAYADALPGMGFVPLFLDDEEALIACLDAADPTVAVDPLQRAYIMYTSGSTGTPKGVCISHANIVRLVCNTNYLSFLPGEVTAQAATPTFDAATFEIWGPLLHGGHVVGFDKATVLNPRVFAAELRRHAVDILFLTTALFNQIAAEEAEAFNGIKHLLFGGQLVDAKWPLRVFDAGFKGRMLHVYGPTESTTYAAWHPVVREDCFQATIPIGKALANTTMELRNAALQPVPPGVCAEIFIGGDGLAEGYLNQPEATTRAFLFIDGKRYYRTGDYARYREDGAVCFIGRRDHQVKVRGFRIELGEIETAMARHPRVSEAAVKALDDASGNKLPVAWFTGTAEPEDLRAHLAETLPSYMLPNRLYRIDVMPLTATGKIDKRALKPEDTAPPEAATDDTLQTPTERHLGTIWQEVLRLEQVGRDADFFDLGGHSLLATQVVSRVRDGLGVDLPIHHIFDAPVLHALAKVIDGLTPVSPTEPRPVASPTVDTSDEPLCLSFAQQRLWFLDQYESDRAVYNIPMPLRLEGPLNRTVLAQALDDIRARHDILRAAFQELDGSPYVEIAPMAPLELPEEDFSGMPDPEACLEARRAVETNRPFNLTEGNLMRAVLIRMGENDHALLLTLHHIICDGWSMAIFKRELTTCYADRQAGRAPCLPPLPMQYTDFARNQRAVLQGPRGARELAYWREQLADLPATLNLPLARPRPTYQTYSGAFHYFSFSQETEHHVTACCRQYGVTPFMFFMTAFQIFLARLSGQTDFTVGVPIAGRNQAEVEPLIGFFVNTLVLRAELAAHTTFHEVLAAVRAQTLAAYDHQNLPFEQLVDHLQPERDLSTPPLFQVMFSLLNTPDAPWRLTGLQVKTMASGAKTTQFDLTLNLTEHQGCFNGLMEYNTDLFDAEQIAEMTRRFVGLCAAAAVAPETAPTRLPMLLPHEREHLTRQDHESEACGGQLLHELISRAAAGRPEAPAVRAGNRVLTYAALEARANGLAHGLHAAGVRPGDAVGLAMARTPELIIAVAAVLKAGAAYVPLDPTYPPARLHQACTGVRLLLTDDQAHPDLAPGVPRLPATAYGTCDAAPRITTHPLLPAYLIYTSGSTGTPKGVTVRHTNITAAFQAWEKAYALTAGDVHLQMAGHGFDVFSGDLTRALCSGGTLVLCPRETLLDAERLYTLIGEVRPTVAEFVPAVVRELTDEVHRRGGRLTSFRLMIVGSDIFHPHEYRAVKKVLRPNARLLNSYGLTETTVDSAFFETDSPETLRGTVPIGKAMAHNRLYIVDRHLEPVPTCVAGELVIGGPAVGGGYVDLPARTAAAFIPDPFQANGRLYRTGDLVLRHADGGIHFLGRADCQMKIRGVRIEMGEIVAALEAHEDIVRAHVKVVKHNGETVPAAWLQTKYTNWNALRAFLETRLPAPVIPAVFVALDCLPLSPNGKVDAGALSLPAQTPDTLKHYTAPRTDTEKVLTEIWCDLLGLERVDVHANFFALGGHSLLAARVLAHARKALQRDITLRTFFEHPTPAGLAACLDPEPATEETPIAAHVGPAVLSFGQQRLWFLEQLEPGNRVYHLAEAFDIDGYDETDVARALHALIDHHASLRTVFPEVDGSPTTHILPSLTPAVPLLEAETDPGEALKQLTLAPYDLANGPLLRAARITTRGRTRLILAMHHILADGWSLELLRTHLRDLLEGKALAPPPCTYADWAAWQRGRLDAATADALKAWWADHLSGTLETLDLPFTRPRARVQQYAGGVVRFQIPAATTVALRAFATAEGATCYMAFMAAYQVLLHRYSGRTRFCIGTPTSGRDRIEVEQIIGLFASTLPARADVSQEPDFRTMVRRVREHTLAESAHQTLPFEILTASLNVSRNLSHHPLFQVMFTYAAHGVTEAQAHGAPVGGYEDDTPTAFDLNLGIGETSGGCEAALVFDRHLFDPAFARSFCAGYLHLLDALVAGPDTSVGRIPLMDDAARERVLHHFNPPIHPVAFSGSVAVRIARVAEREPSRPALTVGGDTYSYGDLVARMDQWAATLYGRGVRAGDRVAVVLERHVDLPAVLLGITRLGAVYLPLDPHHPEERLGKILDDAAVALVVAEAGWGCASNAPRLTPNAAEATPPPPLPELPQPTSEDPAYIIYTSGSTGMPKGVVVPHGAVHNFLDAMAERPGLYPNDRLLATTTVSFDIAGLELFLPLVTGAQLVLAPKDWRGTEWAEALETYDITVMQATPSGWQMLCDAGWQGKADLRAFCGGEALSDSLAATLQARCAEAWNLYGPTETTIWSSVHRLDGGPVALGLPIRNTSLYVLDPHLQPVPLDVPGELCIGGAGVAHGYHARESLTRERFVPNPFGTGRLYRTGDRVVRRDDGLLLYLGRSDHQLKVRGYRIEAGEIEARLLASGFERALVLLRDTHLTAYLQGEPTVDPAACLRYKLPDYMIPTRWVFLSRFPLTPNGKVDRAALPLPEAEPRGPRGPVTDPLQGRLATLWEEVLGVEGIGPEDNFFALGGHSLMASRLMYLIQTHLGVRLPTRKLFEAQTLERLAAAVADGRDASPEHGLCVTLNDARRGPVLFCIHPAGGRAFAYGRLAALLPHMRLVGIEARGAADDRPPHTTMDALVTCYLAEMKKCRPHGPYHLVGYSLGGNIAHALATRLHHAGEQVASLILLDAVGQSFWEAPAENEDALLARMLGTDIAPGTTRADLWQTARDQGLIGPSHDEEATSRLLRVIQAHDILLDAHVPEFFPGNALLIRAQDQGPSTRDSMDLGWISRVGHLDIHTLPGQHHNLLRDPQVVAVAECIAAALAPPTHAATQWVDGALGRDVPARLPLPSWNQTAEVFPPCEGLHRLFERQAARTPNAPAVRFKNRTRTYAEVDRRADQLAHRLAAAGVGPGHGVALLMERALETPEALLAVLKCGAFFVPVDPAWPPDRRHRVVTEARVGVVLTQTHLSTSHSDLLQVHIDEDHTGCDRLPAWPAVGPSDRAYVVFTSGSTGSPKGVIGSHGAIVNRLEWMRRRYPLGAADRVVQKTPFCFDISIWEHFWPLSMGACLVPAEPGGHRDSAYLCDLLARERVTAVHFVPSMLDIFLREATRVRHCLKWVFVSGEAVSPTLQTRHHAALGVPLVNLYGPTECAIEVTHWTCVPEDSGPVPIGRPIANVSAHVLRPNGTPAAVGESGELCIGGAAPGQGYLNRPALTARQFRPDPHTTGGRLYHTGDLARFRPDGTLAFLGRADHQVKIRGYRIELGEIEAVLETHPAVSRALANVTSAPDGTAVLSVYYTGEATAPSHLRLHAAESLPDYMVPVHFVWLAQFPVTATGKVDRTVLPTPGTDHVPVMWEDAPRGDLETRIAGLWCEHLGLTRVGRSDHFFAVGGYSLLATQMVYDLRNELGIDLPVRAMLDHPCIKDMAVHIERLRRGAHHPDGRLVHLRGAHEAEPPLYLIHPAGGGVNMYGTLAQSLDPTRPVVAIQAAGIGDGQAPDSSVEAMARRYLQDIRTHQSTGPIFLAGFSMGGHVALHLAEYLRAEGRRIAYLGLIDTAAPGLSRTEGPLPAPLQIYLQAAGRTTENLSEAFTRLAPDQQLAELHREGLANGRISPGFSLADMAELAAVTIAHLQATRSLPDTTYDGEVQLYRAAEQPESLDHLNDLGWGAALPRLVVHPVGGHHRSPFRVPHVHDLGRIIAAHVQQGAALYSSEEPCPKKS